MKHLKINVFAIFSFVIGGAFAGEYGQVNESTIAYSAAPLTVTCSALQPCDIELEQGESVVSSNVVDKSRWSVSTATTGDGDKKSAHFILMPVQGNLRTTMEIVTNKRTYQLSLVSDEATVMQKIAFGYSLVSDTIADISKRSVIETPAEMATPGVPHEQQPDLTVKPIYVASAATEGAAKPVQPPHAWVLKPEHKSIREVIEDWAADAGENGEGLDVIWETRDFPIDVKREKKIFEGDFWKALEIIGESYRDSDAAFQIKPTAFGQIVVVPMAKSN